MKLQDAVKKEVFHIALGTAIVFGLENIVYLVIKQWSGAVLAGSILGSVLAFVNFLILALTVQNIAATSDEKRARLKMQFSYSMRMLMILVGLIIAFALPFFDGISAIFPLLAPRLTIFAMQILGLYRPQENK